MTGTKRGKTRCPFCFTSCSVFINILGNVFELRTRLVTYDIIAISDWGESGGKVQTKERGTHLILVLLCPGTMNEDF